MDEILFECPNCEFIGNEADFSEMWEAPDGHWICPECVKGLEEVVMAIAKNEFKQVEFYDVKVTISLRVPTNFKGIDPWPKFSTLDSYIEHWLYEGYYIDDSFPDLPNGIVIKEVNVAHPVEWIENIEDEIKEIEKRKSERGNNK